jgi:hypothetical protein
MNPVYFGVRLEQGGMAPRLREGWRNSCHRVRQSTCAAARRGTSLPPNPNQCAYKHAYGGAYARAYRNHTP